jgi:ribose 5-phosphate isomerase A
MKEVTQLKKSAAEFAVTKFIRSDMIIGLGTGSTAIFALYKISELLKQGELKNLKGIASSLQIESEAKRLEIPISNFDDHSTIDVTIDGADEVDPELNLIKGGGGALLREKIIAQASKREIIVIDESKRSEKLGTKWPVPVEVIPFGWETHEQFFKSIGAKKSILRLSDSGIPFTTDEGNFIMDLHFGIIENVNSLAGKLKSRAGIVEHGLFIDIATDLVVASEKGVQYLSK